MHKFANYTKTDKVFQFYVFIEKPVNIGILINLRQNKIGKYCRYE